MDHLYNQFLEYSRKKEYYISDERFEYSKESMLHTAHNSNPYCADTMQLMVLQKEIENNNNQHIKTTSNNTILFHRGSYCALAHASAELLCESFVYLDTCSFKYTVQYILNTVPTHTQQEALQDNDYLQVAMSVLQRKMSLSRSYCFLLAWKTMAMLLETMSL